MDIASTGWGFVLGMAVGAVVRAWLLGGTRAPQPSRLEILPAGIALSDRPNRDAWERLAGDAVLLLPIVTRQIEETVLETERAISQVNVSILAIAGRAEWQVSRMKAAFENLNTRVNGSDSTPEDLTATNEVLTDTAKDLAADVARIVVALQFQDITKQQLLHVIQPLEHLRKSLDALLRHHGSTDGDTEGLLHALHDRYTMESERRLMMQTLAGSPAGPSGDNRSDIEHCDVTLFEEDHRPR